MKCPLCDKYLLDVKGECPDPDCKYTPTLVKEDIFRSRFIEDSNMKGVDKFKDTLFFGDNIVIMNNIKDSSIDLIYLDPPFKSDKEYTLIHKNSKAQIKAYEDIWTWGPESIEAFNICQRKGNSICSELIQSFGEELGKSNMMAYISMIGARLFEFKRVLKSTGSIYVHCDYSSSHYLKILLDNIFGIKNFRNEIIWKRTNSPKSQSKTFGAQHDVLFFYTKSNDFTFNSQYGEKDEKYKKPYIHNDKDGKGPYRTIYLIAAGLQKSETRKTFEFQCVSEQWVYSKEKLQKWWNEGKIYVTNNNTYYKKQYLNEMIGPEISDLWIDKEVPPAQNTNYPTEKPIGLLTRIIKTSSNEGDIVLDPFLGYATSLIASSHLKRKWIGIESSYTAFELARKRIDEESNAQYEYYGYPYSYDGAVGLSRKDPYQFQKWVVEEIFNGNCGKRGGDGGVDGVKYFIIDENRMKIIISVKGGKKVLPTDMRDLIGTVAKQDAAMGILVCLNSKCHTQHSLREASVWKIWKDGRYGLFEKFQFFTIENWFNNINPHIPNEAKIGNRNMMKRSKGGRKWGDIEDGY